MLPVEVISNVGAAAFAYRAALGQHVRERVAVRDFSWTDAGVVFVPGKTEFDWIRDIFSCR